MCRNSISPVLWLHYPPERSAQCRGSRTKRRAVFFHLRSKSLSSPALWLSIPFPSEPDIPLGGSKLSLTGPSPGCRAMELAHHTQTGGTPSTVPPFPAHVGSLLSTRPCTLSSWVSLGHVKLHQPSQMSLGACSLQPQTSQLCLKWLHPGTCSDSVSPVLAIKLSSHAMVCLQNISRVHSLPTF